MKCSHVAVLRGGPSTEYEVSLQTGAGVLSVLQDEICDVRDVLITKQGEWLVDGFVRTPEQALTGIDAVFIALHGSYGEDGTVQRILDRLAVPYTGSGAYASAVAMNKALTKDLLKAHGVRMAKHVRVTRDTVRDTRQTAENIGRMFGSKYIVKPVAGGSSFNTIIAGSLPELARALSQVLDSTEAALVEEYISGREATVAILDRFRTADHYAMPVIEIVPPSGATFFDTTVKYNGTTDEICPGRFTPHESDELQQTAALVHRTLGLRHYSRSDFIVTTDGPYFLEVNTLPGLTAESLFPKAMESVGGTYRELVRHLLRLATNDVSYG